MREECDKVVSGFSSSLDPRTLKSVSTMLRTISNFPLREYKENCISLLERATQITVWDMIESN